MAENCIRCSLIGNSQFNQPHCRNCSTHIRAKDLIRAWDPDRAVAAEAVAAEADKISKPMPHRRQGPDEIRAPDEIRGRDKICNHAARGRNKMRGPALPRCKDVKIDRHVIQISQIWAQVPLDRQTWGREAWDKVAWVEAA